jgi:hypothetical protein
MADFQDRLSLEKLIARFKNFAVLAKFLLKTAATAIGFEGSRLPFCHMRPASLLTNVKTCG